MENHKIIAWFTDNPVAANLMMLIFLAGGTISLFSMHKEEFPNIEPGIVQIQVPYLGAAPEEVEEAVCIRIEEAIEGVDGMDRVHTIAREGMCSVMIELLQDANITTALNDIKGKVDAISTFPSETEKPIVSSMQFRGQTISLIVHGDTDEATLKLIAEEVRDDISALEGISQVAVSYARPWEISIEVSEQTLRQYNLTMTQIADAIRRASLDLPGGSIKTEGGEILLRSKGQAYRGYEYEDIVVVTRPDGTNITLGDIAIVRDDFQEGFLRARFNGERAVSVMVYRVGEEDTITSAQAVKQYIEKKRSLLPRGVSLSIWIDESVALDRRIGALTKNAYAGLALVLLILTMFLRFKVAIWVAAGIPIAIMGAIWAFPFAGINISSLTVLAFILVLGIVVDDAIVVGERIFSHETTDRNHREAAIAGTAEVITPVVFGVLTTIAAFLPILLIEGRMGEFFSIIGWVVLVCLIFSILECMFILPAHLAHRKTEGYFMEKTAVVRGWIAFQSKFANSLEWVATEVYRPFLVKTLQWRWVTWAVATFVLVTSIALIASGRVIFQFFPAVEGDRIYATLTMPEGINVEFTEEAASQIERAAFETAREINEELGFTDRSVIQQSFQSIGVNAARSNGPPAMTAGGSHLAEIVVTLVPIEDRPGWNTNRIAEVWREKTGSVTDAVELQFTTNTFNAGDPIALQLKGRDIEQLRDAAQLLKAELARYPGVMDLTDSFRAGKQEIKLDILPEAKPLGLSLNDLARQVRQAFYGEEAQRIQRGTDDVRVMVRYPEEERRSLGNLENMRIRTNDGTEVPFSTVARVDYGTGFSSINREDQQRVVDVKGDVNRSVVTPEEVIAAVEKAVCERGTSFGNRESRCTNADFPGVAFKISGEQEERNKALGSMVSTIPLALMIIFALLAIPLKSYMQPLVIMSVIPFGAVGAIVGHYIMGWDLIFFSMLGIIALSGVVVNASLVLVDYINRQRRQGVDLFEAVANAGVVRFRPIILTSVTTFVGLIPLMTNNDPETFMFIPMAISLAFGVLFATAITLFLVPSLYLMLEDWLNFWGLNNAEDPALVVHNDVDEPIDPRAEPSPTVSA
ncbi:MAG: efflux RND transporter permease subunit [Pseudomonadales bacterium]|nr:efflux RND transporter permease subunit [Pseudomonadales bacterium]MBO6566331.1 efflux RND transporter permease subunit [Pseudomonadales bacterium]MBO6595651.1 efflux RND transporter permease subunit [Pseudomonadales bacterium]MBO6655720.1 efflux RND transporter permease subunit [Pseudomonadales bacterium]MBO6702151.1 efflux RND transporter permease subunit [Pseudomonadales bacterium]